MTKPDYRAMCAELIDELEAWIGYGEEADCADAHAVIDRARALLAEPEAEGPSDPISELVSQCRPLEPEMAECLTPQARWQLYGDDAQPVAEGVLPLKERHDFIAGYREGLADGRRIIECEEAERPTPQPVAVSERLPGPKDVNEDGEVWIIEEGYSYALGDTGDYDWEPHRIVLRSIGEFDAKNGRTWLPANALPIPEATNG